MEANTRVTVHLVPVPGDNRRGNDKVQGRLALPYDGEGPVHLRSGSDRRIVPAEQVRWVETRGESRDEPGGSRPDWLYS